jgi:hypothetical protein
MKTIGYLEGTDPEFLTTLVCNGYKTLPIGNGKDNHGKNIAYITVADKVDLLVGYIHKVSPVPGMKQSLKDLLNPGIIHNIPIFLLAPKEVLADAQKMVAEVVRNEYVKVMDPKDLRAEALKILR